MKKKLVSLVLGLSICLSVTGCSTGEAGELEYTEVVDTVDVLFDAITGVLRTFDESEIQGIKESLQDYANSVDAEGNISEEDLNRIKENLKEHIDEGEVEDVLEDANEELEELND